jgi:hypothetical protein
VDGRADRPDPPSGGGQDHQGRHGHGARNRPVRSRATGSGADGPPDDCDGLRRRCDSRGPAVLRDARGAHYQLLRSLPAVNERATPALRARLRGCPARAPEGRDPPRPEALERPGHGQRWRGLPEDHRFRGGQGHYAAPDRTDAVHRAWRARRHAGVHEPRAGRSHRARRRYPDRRLRPRLTPLRAADGPAALRSPDAPAARARRHSSRHSGGRSAETQHSRDRSDERLGGDGTQPAHRAPGIWPACFAGISTGSR